MSTELEKAVRAALAKVIDPELRRPITELNMVKSVTVAPDGTTHVGIYLTTSACPKKTEITERVSAAVADVPGTAAVTVDLDVMSDEQRTELRKQLRGDAAEPVIPFAQPGSLTRVYAVASGKGGVGKSSVTVNLAAALAARGLSVGLLDADIYGHSVPRMMGTSDRPTQVESMILPPVAHDVKVISIAQFTQGNTPVVWRGPMLHRALQQFLADVYWGDLDVLLLDLPPGTGDVAISVAQLLPGAEIVVVTTPQSAAAEVAERAGAIALQTRQRIVGVVENMSGLVMPDGSTMQIFGEGGGRQVAENLSRAVGADVPLLGQVPLDPDLVTAGDSGVPLVLSAPESPTNSPHEGGGWPGCHSGWTQRPADVDYVASASNGAGPPVGPSTAGGVALLGLTGPSNSPLSHESSPSRRCLVIAARGVIPRSF
jgi:ATP-binding protein involved in chromosome partitioning